MTFHWWRSKGPSGMGAPKPTLLSSPTNSTGASLLRPSRLGPHRGGQQQQGSVATASVNTGFSPREVA